MPAIVTHDFFGRELFDELYSFIGGSRDEAQAFLLGNQGPDPLFYVVISPRYVLPQAANRSRWMHGFCGRSSGEDGPTASPCPARSRGLHGRSSGAKGDDAAAARPAQVRELYTLGSTLHRGDPSALLVAFKESLDALEYARPADYAIARAYALGFLSHYMLDSCMHPFTYAQQYALCDAEVPGLSRRDGHEVHAVIESELDELVLFAKLGDTVAQFNPARNILQASESVLGVVSELYADVARRAYSLMLPEGFFARAVKDYRLVERAFYSPGGSKRAVLGTLERCVRPHSFCQAASLRAVELTESVFDNRERKSWENPFTGERRTSSFWDIFEEAIARAVSAIEFFEGDDFDGAYAAKLTGGLDFSGAPARNAAPAEQGGTGA